MQSLKRNRPRRMMLDIHHIELLHGYLTTGTRQVAFTCLDRGPSDVFIYATCARALFKCVIDFLVWERERCSLFHLTKKKKRRTTKEERANRVEVEQTAIGAGRWAERTGEKKWPIREEEEGSKAFSSTQHGTLLNEIKTRNLGPQKENGKIIIKKCHGVLCCSTCMINIKASNTHRVNRGLLCIFFQ